MCVLHLFIYLFIFQKDDTCCTLEWKCKSRCDAWLYKRQSFQHLKERLCLELSCLAVTAGPMVSHRLRAGQWRPTNVSIDLSLPTVEPRCIKLSVMWRTIKALRALQTAHQKRYSGTVSCGERAIDHAVMSPCEATCSQMRGERVLHRAPPASHRHPDTHWGATGQLI